jgi:hypothetical protein
MTKDAAVFGAAGSMGTRVTNALNDDPYYWMLNMRAGDAGGSRNSTATGAKCVGYG